MKTKFLKLICLFVLVVTTSTVMKAQTKSVSYDPFTSTNLSGLTTNQVSENSIHTYRITGDVNLTGSTFVFKVVGGTIITSATDETAVSLNEANGTGTHSVAESVSDNDASIFVKWDNGQAENYVAVYELTSNSCVRQDVISGFNINITAKPVVALALLDDQICSSDDILIDINVTSATSGNSPWTLTINDGTNDIDFIFYEGSEPANAGDFDHSVSVTVASNAFSYQFAAPGASYLNELGTGASTNYVFTANQFDDVITQAEPNDSGNIDAGGNSVTATVYPLPTIGGMTQN